MAGRDGDATDGDDKAAPTSCAAAQAPKFAAMLRPMATRVPVLSQMRHTSLNEGTADLVARGPAARTSEPVKTNCDAPTTEPD